MENTVQNRELSILKIIEKHPGIHHRLLLRIINDKSLMAKATAEKNIKILINDKKIHSYKYGKEIQYVLSDGELSEKDLKKKVSATLKKLKAELKNISNEFDHFDYEVRRDLSYEFVMILEHLSGRKSDLLRHAKENKITDMSYVSEIANEILDLTNDFSIDDEFSNKKRELAIKTANRLYELEWEYAKSHEKKNKMRSSKKRNDLTLKIKQMDSEITKLHRLLEDTRNELKSVKGR